MIRPNSVITAAVAGAIILSFSFPALALDELDQGVKMYERGSYSQALLLFQRAAKMDPKNPRAWIWLGATYLRLGEADKAVSALQRAITLDRQGAPAFLFLGIAYLKVGKIAEGRSALERVLALDRSSEYGASAAEWLRRLKETDAGPFGETSVCASRGSLARPQPPPPIPTVDDPRVRISNVEVAVQKDALLVDGLLDNLGSEDVRNIRVLAIGFGLTGREVVHAATTISPVIEGDDSREFTLRLGITPPPIWIRVQVQDYEGRQRTEPLHAIQFALRMQDYAEVARPRVKVSAAVHPPWPSTSHKVCLRIDDTDGFAVQSVAVRVLLRGLARGLVIQQEKSAVVNVERGSVVNVSWSAPVEVDPEVQVGAVTFADLPAIK